MIRYLMMLLWLAGPAFGQGMPTYEQKVLQASVTQGTGTLTGTVTTGLNYMRLAYCVLNVTASSGTPTLDVKLQASPDQGTTFCDRAAFTQATGVGKTILLLSSDRVAGPAAQDTTASPACVDGSLAAGTAIQGAWGDRIRVKAVVAGGTPSVTFTVTCQVSGF